MTPEQKQALSAPLDRSHVKQRKQSGRALFYIEGWHAIAEANRIFGFDAWTRETMDIRCVSERERSIGEQRKPGWGVSYIAKVRVTVDGVVREGIGAGHGIDADLGLAHESAIKEAETDAMKRSLMTFGNPFGLALYDKEQAQVCDTPRQSAPAKEPIDPAESESLKDFLIKSMDYCKSSFDMDEWAESNRPTIETKLLPKDKGLLRTAWTTRKHAFIEQEKDAA